MHEKQFAEVAFWGNLEQKEDAKKYLEFWKKNLVFKLQRDSFNIEIIDEQWIERPPNVVSCLAQYGSLALKLTVKANFNYELRLF